MAASVKAGRYEIVVVIAWIQKTCAIEVAMREVRMAIENFMMIMANTRF